MRQQLEIPISIVAAKYAMDKKILRGGQASQELMISQSYSYRLICKQGSPIKFDKKEKVMQQESFGRKNDLRYHNQVQIITDLTQCKKKKKRGKNNFLQAIQYGTESMRLSIMTLARDAGANTIQELDRFHMCV